MRAWCVLSRGRVRLTGPNPLDPVDIEANMLADARDMKAAVACVDLCREIGHSAPLQPFVKCASAPGTLRGSELEADIRSTAQTYWHQAGTAKMGREALAIGERAGDLLKSRHDL